MTEKQKARHVFHLGDSERNITMTLIFTKDVPNNFYNLQQLAQTTQINSSKVFLKQMTLPFTIFLVSKLIICFKDSHQRVFHGIVFTENQL